MEKGKLVVPMFLVKRPRKGIFDRVYQADAWRNVIVAVGDRYPYLHLPIDDRIREYILLIRPIKDSGLTLQEGWRVYSFDAEEIQDANVLRFPNFQKLQLLDDRSDADAIQKKIDIASKARGELGTWPM